MKIVFFLSKGYDSKNGIKLDNIIKNDTPIGILSISAVLRKEGHEIKIFNAGYNYTYTNTQWVDKICNFNPDYIGFSTMTFNFNDSYDVCSLVKAKLPNTKIIFGGVHTAIHKQSILNNYKNIDFLIVGDGEYAFRDLVKGVLPRTIPGVFYIDGDTIIGKEQSEADLPNLDELPFPAYDLVENFPYCNKPELFTYPKTPVCNVVTSRGCPFKCSFCYNATVNKKIRFNSAKYIVDMLEWLNKEHSVKHFLFYDDMFTLDSNRIVEFCDEIKKRNLKITFNCFLRINFDRKLVLRLKEAGLYLALIGIESFDQRMLDLHKPGIKVENIKSDLEFLFQNKIWVAGLLIIGLPGETNESIATTIKTISEVPLKAIGRSRFMPYYGTPIFSELDKHGVLLADIEDWRNFNVNEFIYLPTGIESKEKLCEYYNKMGKAYGSSPYYSTIIKNTLKSDLHSYLRLLKNFIHIISNTLNKYKNKVRS